MITKNIYILGTIHSNHDKNPNYRYKDIINAIESFNPDVIGVEIRPQDMKEDNGYLSKYYPPEMVLVKDLYESKVPVYGFDWRGHEMENKRIERWLTDIPNIKTLMEKYDDIATLIKERKLLMESFYRNCTLEQCQKVYAYKLKGLNPIDEMLNTLLVEYGYNDLVQYYKDRKKHLGDNVMKIIKDYPDQSIIIITGLEHKSYLTDYIEIIC
jgi:hypothetical protein